VHKVTSPLTHAQMLNHILCPHACPRAVACTTCVQLPASRSCFGHPSTNFPDCLYPADLLVWSPNSIKYCMLMSAGRGSHYLGIPRKYMGCRQHRCVHITPLNPYPHHAPQSANYVLGWATMCGRCCCPPMVALTRSAGVSSQPCICLHSHKGLRHSTHRAAGTRTAARG
jgi:hypothetical protein